jgi:hypothetical protein
MKWRIYWLISLFSKRSHYNAKGLPKQAYSKQAANKAALAMWAKTGRSFDAYRCWVYCGKWHIGGSVKND